MKLIVNPHKIEIKKELINEKEINITECEFEFAEEITDDYVKEAYFTKDNKTYKQIITNNKCSIPYEVLKEKGQIEIGVVAYLVENEEEIKRYNPSPVYITTLIGSLKDNAENSEPITPSEMEQYEQALEDGLNEVANVDIDAIQTETGIEVTITDRTGTSKMVEVLNGEKGDTGATGQTGADGKDAKINGFNTINITAGSNISLNQENDTLEINASVPDVSNFITKDVSNLTYYTLKTATGSSIDMSIDSSTYVLTVSLKNSDGTILNTKTVDLPLETMVVNGSYDSTNKKIILTLQNGNTIEVPVGDLVSGLQSEITNNNKLSSDLVDDTNNTNKFVSTSEKQTWNAKSDFSGSYNDLTDKPTIPTVPTNVSAFTNDAGYLTQHQDISDKLDTSAVKTTTNTTQGNVYDVTYINTMLGDVETLLGGI